MTHAEIAQYRLYNQQISRPSFETPGEVVAWLGAVQAQDYLGSLWAIGLRMQAALESSVEQAIANRSIIRTWPMRGTLHFVAAADIRWMLELLTPRVVESAGTRHKQLGLDEPIFMRSKKLLERALRDGRQLTRNAIYEVLEKGRISTDGQRGIHILGRLAQDGFICFGAREGKQQTFALLEEWTSAKRKPRDESLAELARRYFTGHGPATVRDFCWWSGLTMADARGSLEMAKSELVQEEIGGQAYWVASSVATVPAASPTAYLLPPFDEYTVAYKDRSAVLDPLHTRKVNSGNGIFYPIIVVDGRVVGTWKRAFRRGELLVSTSRFTRFNERESRACAAAAGRYGEFLGAPVVLS